MLELDNKLAVVTGGAGGLGLAMAHAFARRGMQVVLADLPGVALHQAQAELVAQGHAAIAMAVDVSDQRSVQALADQVALLGGADLLCNNAGITGDRPRTSWTHDPENWRRVLDTNLMGVVHGLHCFVPQMLAHGRPAFIVNTASMAGLMAVPYIAPYVASKSALVALSESLALELQAQNAAIHVAVLCPGLVPSGLTGPPRDHPQSLAAEPSHAAQHFERLTQDSLARCVLKADDVAQQLLEGLAERRFYILTHEGSQALANQRFERLNRELTLSQRSFPA